ncbi:NAD(P)/FAD-dependent oxidoreductase [Agrobacterium sp. rho-13.3]|uniref:NAD(P)/FAD-dependent oxidoreductase n=1 Tax=Agrobacterium sp. rho-13.3 TaxID=3072980 RepID=UPI002A0D5AD8|nr:FAD-dependent oxidoreductase [Agrobacterium sp. rho-13.3]MDX8310825.1 FAD-dependent oxidoreductase [Agrobacterium sp. rho-13.3]
MDLTTGTNKRDAKRRIAVIGSGISGLSAAWLLDKSADVTLFESDSRLGGHANTVFVDQPGKAAIPVDTGFIVYNVRNYPNLVALFEHLDVPTEASDMSFAASLQAGRLEYSGSSLGGLFGQKSNLFRPRFWRMVRDVLRFYKQAPALLNDASLHGMSLGDYLDRNRYSKSFIDDHLLPMGAAIWSTTAADMRAYPLQAFIRFFVNHGLVQLSDRPQWRTVKRGSREYISRLIAEFKGTIVLDSQIAGIQRSDEGVKVLDRYGHLSVFDDVVIATHADQALALLADADADERSLLGAFEYTRNAAVLHSDETLMPKRRNVWSSWNYLSEPNSDGTEQLCLTYWMNKLQNIDEATPLFVTLNPSRAIDPAKLIRAFDYAHPLFNTKALEAQKLLWSLQGRRNTWFCGAHFGSGFHEDGIQSGLAVAEALGGVKRPWTVENESGRIFLNPETVLAP